MYAGREERGVNGGMKKWVGQWPKREERLRNIYREERLRNGYREEIGLPKTGTGRREWL